MPPSRVRSPPSPDSSDAALSPLSSRSSNEASDREAPSSPASIQAEASSTSGDSYDSDSDSQHQQVRASSTTGRGVKRNGKRRQKKTGPLHRGSRLRMRAFLEHLLDTGEVAGLKYVSRKQRIFQMPWRHAKSTAYDAQRDSVLFKLWGLNTGRLQEDEMHSDKTIWKVNFRCALRNVQNTVVEIGDGPVDGDYKTFQFRESEISEAEAAMILEDTLPKSESPPPSLLPIYQLSGPMQRHQARCFGGQARSTPKLFLGEDGGSPGLSTISMPDELPPVTGSTAAVGGGGDAKTCLDLMSSTYSDVSVSNDPFAAINVTAQSCLHPANTATSVPPMDVPITSPVGGVSSNLPLWPPSTVPLSGLGQLTPPGISLDTSGLPPVDTSALVLGSILPNISSFFGQQLYPADTENLVSYEMYVKVAYRGCAMAAMRVSHRDGCRLFYGSPPPRNAMDLETQERLFGSRKLMQLSLPPPRTAQSLIPAMWILLESTQRGLILQMENNDIYATRLCATIVYYANQEGDVVALERGKRTCIFSFAVFQETYRRYKNPHPSSRLIACERPCYEVMMSIGQHWGTDRHRDNNLISLNITHSLGEKMIESLRQEFFKSKTPFDTDYMSVDEKDDDDRRAEAAVAAALQAPTHKSLESVGPHAAGARGKSTSTKTAGNMRKTKEKRSHSKQLARGVQKQQTSQK